MKNQFGSCVYHDKYAYGIDDTKLVCMSFSEGGKKDCRSGNSTRVR